MDARHGTITEQGNGWLLRFERRLVHPPAKVWAAITQPGQMSRWFDHTEILSLEVGGTIRFMHEAAKMESRGRITALEPERLIEWEWTGPFGPASIIRWEIHPNGDGVRLVMTQTIDRGQRGVLARTLAGWHVCLDRLEAMLGGGVDGGGRHGGWPALHLDYLKRLGPIADDAEVKQTGGVTECRFDRTLPHPAANVWRAISDPDQIGRWLAQASTAPRSGAALTLTFGGVHVAPTRVTAFEEGRLLELAFEDGGSVRFELTDLGGATQLVLIGRHPAIGAEGLGNVAGWHFHFDGLGKVLAGEPFDAMDGADARRLEAHYAELLA